MLSRRFLQKILPSTRNFCRQNLYLLKNNGERESCIVTKRKELTHDTLFIRAEFPDPNMMLGLPVGNHVLVCFERSGHCISRAYTPISHPLQKGYFDLLIKVYRPNADHPEGGCISQMIEKVAEGDHLHLIGPIGMLNFHDDMSFRFLNKYYNKPRTLSMISGGSGITPHYQILQYAKSLPFFKDIEMNVLCLNKTEDDILLKQELSSLAQSCSNVKVHHAVENPTPSWNEFTGRLSSKMLESVIPKPSIKHQILLCGPHKMDIVAKEILVGMGHLEDNVIP